MSNDRLRKTMAAAGVDAVAVAERAQVDPKTVQRWLKGRVPHARHRSAVAAMLREEEDYLWPAAAGARADGTGVDATAEVVAAYAHRASASVSLWAELLAVARARIELLGYAMLHLPEQHPRLAELLGDKAGHGCQVRIALADPKCDHVRERDRLEDLGGTLPARIHTTLRHFAGVADTDGVQIRLHDAHLYSAVYRFDDQMLVTPYLSGVHGFQHPLLHLRRLGPYGVFEAYARQFDRVWTGTTPAAQPVAREDESPRVLEVG
ncbi:MAG: DUF5919 domain-containing protein [Actinomycetota bacterium]|nr:DUF5919 domain-containing protein [Actinomycetota bacterium]